MNNNSKFFYKTNNKNNKNFNYNKLIDKLSAELDCNIQIQKYKHKIKMLNISIEALKNNKNKNDNKLNSFLCHSLHFTGCVKREHYLYIKKYGVPKDKIFIPSLLAEFMD